MKYANERPHQRSITPAAAITSLFDRHAYAPRAALALVWDPEAHAVGRM